MRIAVFLLVLANLLFFAWSRGDLGSGEPDPLRVGELLRADQIRLVSNDRPPAPVQETPALPAGDASQEICVVLNDLSPANANTLQHLFTEELPTFRLSRTDPSGGTGYYWVHIPPFKTRRAAESKVAELKDLGVQDYFILSDGSDSFAISLGLFSTQAAAESSLAALRGKGVRSARLGERPRRMAASRVEILGPKALAEEMRRLIDRVLPQAALDVCAPSAGS
jgi:hypothetical protein